MITIELPFTSKAWESLDISTNLAPTALFLRGDIPTIQGSFCVFSCLFVGFFAVLFWGKCIFNLG
jgi:hypothetical protein